MNSKPETRNPKLIFLIISLCLLTPSLSDSEQIKPHSEQIKRRQAIATDKYYPASTPILLRKIDLMIDQAPEHLILGRLIALIVPHAGIDHSGQIAAHAYKLLRGSRFKTVILIGSNPEREFPGISVDKGEDYETPLGPILIDRKLAEALIAEHEKLDFHPQVHQENYTLEIQLPFLQRVLGDFLIVPVIMGNQNAEYCQILARALINQLRGRRDVLILAVSNLSRFYPYMKARTKDKVTLDAIAALSPGALLKKLSTKECEMTGGGAVAAALLAAKELGADHSEILNYATSADRDIPEISRIVHRVVGYSAAAIYTTDQISRQAGLSLLKTARSSIKEYIEGSLPQYAEVTDPGLSEPKGVYITLLNGQGKVLAEAGHLLPVRPLNRAVQELAVAAATSPLPRYLPLSAADLAEAKVEVSILSPLKVAMSPNLIEPGIHGVALESGWQRALILPQRAAEAGWDREELLRQACRQAGLPEQEWPGKAKVYIFTAQVFKER
ncbi:MAG: AmmeMemoRadiSam system protein B [bacterium]|nr:AmmeMemoRadiSam system protein B [bacterium]